MRAHGEDAGADGVELCVDVCEVVMARTISRDPISRIACAGHFVPMAGSGERPSEQTETSCFGHRCGARAAAELVPYVRHVAVHGVRADDQLCRDLAVVQPVRD